MNWFKKLFGIGDKMAADVHGLPYVKNIDPMPEVKPCKREEDISEPVHVIVKNMLEHPQRWKVSTESFYEDKTETQVRRYTLKDSKTGQLFKAEKTFYFSIFCCYDTGIISTENSWLTQDETTRIEDVLIEVYRLKKARLLRLVKYKENKERARLLEVYK